MCQWTTDSQRLILEHFDTIHSSPSHIYHFALPITPSSSWLHQYYSTEFSQEIKVVRGVSAGWGTCFRTVSLNDYLDGLSCWKDVIAIGLGSGSIIILNAITGIQVAILSGHTEWVTSLAFSPDGASLVSGSFDYTVKLWDMQTGGVVKTFQGHTQSVYSVSISADYTIIASGSMDNTICLWNIQTGECYHTIEQKGWVDYVCFFPLEPNHLMSVSGEKVWQWDIDGQQVAPGYDGSHITFSLDGTQFAVYNGSAIEVQTSDSKIIVAKFHMANINPGCFSFSPDNRVIAVAVGSRVYIWDITSSDPHLLETLIGHTEMISSLAFSSPSSLISVSIDYSVKFWQLGTSSTDPVLVDEKSILLSAPIRSITLRAEDGIAISSHSDGVVRIWDILTGLCKTSFLTPANNFHWIDTQLANGRLISVWCNNEKIFIWDIENDELLRTVYIPGDGVKDFRMSGDGSKVFFLDKDSIQALSIWTGEVVGKVMHGLNLSNDCLLTIDGLKVWFRFSSKPSMNMGWNFGMILGSTPFSISGMPQLGFIGGIRQKRSFVPGIEDPVTKKVVLQLPGRLAQSSDAQWNGQYLVVGYDSGEVLILECNYVPH